MFFWFTAK